MAICSPKTNTDSSSPVHISAALHPGSAPFRVAQVYVDGVKKYETGINGLGMADNGDFVLNVDLPMSAGTRRISVQGVDTAGAFKATVFATVVSGTSCSTNGTPRTITICQPVNNSTASTPLHITAAVHPGTGAAGTLKVVQVYVDGRKKFETDSSGLGNADNGDEILNTDLGIAPGTHRLTVQAVDSGAYKSTVHVTIH